MRGERLGETWGREVGRMEAGELGAKHPELAGIIEARMHLTEEVVGCTATGVHPATVDVYICTRPSRHEGEHRFQRVPTRIVRELVKALPAPEEA